MKKLLILGTLSFSFAFSLGLLVEKNLTKSVAIGSIATISTLSSFLIISKKSVEELQNLNSYTNNLKTIENQVLNLKNQKRQLIDIIDSQNKLKVSIEEEYNSILAEVNHLQEDIQSLNTQRENLENIIVNLESKQGEILQVIENENQFTRTLEQKNSFLVKVERPQEIFIEKNTLYSEKLSSISKDFWSIYNYNIETFRSQIPRNKWGYYWGKLAHGVNILSEEETLLSYFAFYGGSHYYKLVYLLDKFFINITQSHIHINVEIIDYGCGQALGTTCFLDYLVQHNVSNIKIDTITLIEPSQIALSRGVLHINHLYLDSHNLDIKLVNKQLQDLNKNDLSTSNKSIKLHIFSNILDISGFDINNLANTIRESQSGINYFLCVSPTDIKNRIQQFYKFWYQNEFATQEILLSSEDLYQETWRFKLDEFKLEKIHRVQKLFYVNL
jgi:hypothetical protein